jgi:hypothetical protein
VKNHHGFVSLSDEFWDSRELFPINSTDLMDTTPDLTDVAYRSQEYSSAVGLLKTVVLNRAYLGRTAYNPFALLRVGREAMNACVCPPFYLYCFLPKINPNYKENPANTSPE